MSLPIRLLLFVSVIALLAVSWPGAASRGQVALPLRNEPEAAVPGPQAIAHGVVTALDGEIGWSVVVRRAVRPFRASAVARPGGFVLAQDGPVAVTDAGGAVLARLAPGAAVWIPADTAYAVVGLEDRAVDYVEIALRPAPNLGEGGQSLATDLPFAAPEGTALPLDLLRGVLERDAESTIGAGATPSMLLVTRGAVWVTLPTGETVQLTTGAVLQVEGDVVVIGASRTPAAFVVARADAPLPGRLALRNATPVSTLAAEATPVRAATGADSAATPLHADADGDGLPDGAEAEPGADPAAMDSDGDGLTDRDEGEFYGTDVLASDSDGDGLADGEELLVYGSNPLLADTDGDGSSDGDEVAAGTAPLDAANLPVAAAAIPAAATPAPAAIPGVVPGPEAAPGVADALPPGDLDGDGLSNADEVEVYGTDPEVVDSDGDGFSDGGEVMAGTDPLGPLSPP